MKLVYNTDNVSGSRVLYPTLGVEIDALYLIFSQ